MYYRYKSLIAADQEIRLLRIWKSGKGPEVHASLVKASLSQSHEDTPPKYSALSWCWGVPGREKLIMLNGSIIQIRNHLQRFLRALVRHFGELTVWLDALCIDQSDIAEKSLQVTMMGQIYRSAERVYVWLGDGGSSSDFAFNSLKNSATSGPRPELPTVSVNKQHQCFETLFMNPYWTRLWTLQERALAMELWMLCGTWLAKWQDIDLKFNNLRMKAPWSVPTMSSPETSVVGSQYKVAKYTGKRPLVDMVEAFSMLQCEDIRDHVYGLRDIASNGPELIVDYDKPMSHVIFDVLAPSSTPDNSLFETSHRLFSRFPLGPEDVAPSDVSIMVKHPDVPTSHPGEERLCQWVDVQSITPYQRHLIYEMGGVYSFKFNRFVTIGRCYYLYSLKTKQGDWPRPLDAEPELTPRGIWVNPTETEWMYTVAIVL